MEWQQNKVDEKQMYKLNPFSYLCADICLHSSGNKNELDKDVSQGEEEKSELDGQEMKQWRTK